jgi:glycosyltransferase involved in cell wall biosynthesis
MPKVSIITATYNSAKTIRDTILSVKEQSFQDFEHVIVDGGSTDGTLQILEELRHSKLIFITEKDRGIYDALNKGVRMASGEIIGVIGSDDFYPSQDVLMNVAAAFERNNTDSLFGDTQYINDDNKDKVVRYWKAGTYNRNNFLRGWMPPHLSFYIKKEIYLKYGLYREEFKISGDYELMLRVLYKHSISTQYLPIVLVTMRNGGASTRSLRNRLKANLEDRLAWSVNNLTPRFYTLFFKPLLKVPQFFKNHA